MVLHNLGYDNFEINMAALKIAKNVGNMDEIVNLILDQ